MVRFLGRLFIDTELWSFALKTPENAPDLERALGRHEIANEFLKKKLASDQIYITTHQLTEIFHALSFRGAKLDRNFTRAYIENLMKLQNVIVVNTTSVHFKKAMVLSCISGVHVWDFLCVIPVINHVETLFTCDSHFQNKIFETFKKPIQNPVDFWLEL